VTAPAPSGSADVGVGDSPIGWAKAARSALDAGLGRPRLWPFALVAFLLRGGWLLLALPIVVVPSTVGIATFIGPTAITPAGPSASLVEGAMALAVAAVAWFVVGGLAAAGAEALLIVGTLADETPRPRSGTGGPLEAEHPVGVALAGRMLLARVVASLPLALAAAWGVAQAVAATYAELITPTDTATPLPVRVLRDIPEVVALFFVAWLVAETVGAIAIRRVVLFDDGVLRSIAFAVRHLVRRPLASVATILVTLVGSAVLVAPGLVVAAMSWDRVGRGLTGDADAVLVVVLTFLFVVVWVSALALAGAASAWRSVAWTLEVLRADRDRVRRDLPLLAGLTRLVEREASSSSAS
jgi:hypothetical protein